MGIKELSELQSELETLKEENKQAEVNLLMEQGLSREKVCFQVSLQAGNDSANFHSFGRNIFSYVPFQVEEVGTLLMAINNLAEQCYLAAYGPLEDMNILTMMDMVKVIVQN